MSGQKHDDRCMARRRIERYLLVCTCGLSDAQIADHEALIAQNLKEMDQNER